MIPKKLVYFFGENGAEGNASMRNELGGKGANLAEMAKLRIPVPPGFTITTEVCTAYFQHKNQYPAELKPQIAKALTRVEKIVDRKFGDPHRPLLISVRSGARESMPGMMETVLNVGLTTKTIPGLIKLTGNERFVYDAYRRLISMYSDVVMEKAGGMNPGNGKKSIHSKLAAELDKVKKKRGIEEDTELSAEDLKQLCQKFKVIVKRTLKKEFPDNHQEQLEGAYGAVFQSWMGKRAVAYRQIEDIPNEWGTAVTVQAMVFGNMGEDSATGVAFTRNPANGINKFYGEWLINAQGEDVVAGIRTPFALNEHNKNPRNQEYPSLEKNMPRLYHELVGIRNILEKHYQDMQDLEFTIQEGKLYMLQTRTGKRTGPAAVKMAVDMCKEGLIGQRRAIMRVKPEQLDELLHPMIDPVAERSARPIATGLPAGPGGAKGAVVFDPDRAVKWAEKGKKVVLVREETSPEDVQGMSAAEAILTARGGMTSHAALVARGWGKCCVVGCKELMIDYAKKSMTVGQLVIKEGDILTLNGATGNVFLGPLPLIEVDVDKNKEAKKFLSWCDRHRRMDVRANADTPESARQAVEFGAQGIGLTRTEHMFFDESRIKYMRQMIIADSTQKRRQALKKLLPFQKKDFLGIFKALKGRPATIRLLDPPLHEFLPHERTHITKLAKELGVSFNYLKTRIENLEEINPMLGHRGCRLGIVYPEITEMQARAILEAAAELLIKDKKVLPEIMIPLAGHVKEFQHQKAIIENVKTAVKKAYGLKTLKLSIGTMIEVPRAALTADEIAAEADFFSFGTNDLTQMGCGLSRDDAGRFLPHYCEVGIYPANPFLSLDENGIGQLVEIGVDKGRQADPKLKIGICGEHGGDPASIHFFHRVGLDYVSCSPFRIPIARLASAQANLINA